jgi:ornithine cyclodeaminase/alanine dehydrogenase-like protein (mu-crystallin family)
MLVLTRSEVEALLDVDALIDGLEAGFRDVSSGSASVPPRVAAFTPHGYLGAMPGYAAGVLETKLVTVFHDNEAKGLPSHQALIVLFDPATGSPLALMDGTHITATRTAATSALATKLLSRSDASVLSVIGAGVQGRSHAEIVPRVREITELRIASRDKDRSERLAREAGGRAAGTFEEAVRGADIVCVCTDASSPIIDRAWLADGAHVNSVGASPKGGELDRATVTAGVLAVESRTAFQPPPAGAGELAGLDPQSAVELGELLSGTREGRTSDNQITVYKSMGHASEDAVAANLVLEAARQQGAGREVDL